MVPLSLPEGVTYTLDNRSPAPADTPRRSNHATASKAVYPIYKDTCLPKDGQVSAIT